MGGSDEIKSIETPPFDVWDGGAGTSIVSYFASWFPNLFGSPT